MAPPRAGFLSPTPVSLSQHSSFRHNALRTSPAAARRVSLTSRRAPLACVQMPSESAESLHAKCVEHMKHLKSKRMPTFRKMQRRHKQGPAEFRQAQEAADALSKDIATELTQPRDEISRRTPKRHLLRDGVKLSELAVGMQLQGKVQNLVRHGAYVDVGAVRDGLVHVRDMAVDFVHAPADIVRTGDMVTVWVKYVNPVTNVLGLSMVKPTRGFVERMPVRDVEIGKRYEGVVERVTNYGAYVDIGAERLGFLHVAAIWGRRPRETLEYLRIGQKLCVQVDDVDEIRSHIKLRARGKGHRPLQKQGPLGELARMEEDGETTQQKEVVIRQAIERPWDDEEEDEGHEGDEESYEDENFENMYEREVEDDVISHTQLLPDDIERMIEESEDAFDISDFQ